MNFKVAISVHTVEMHSSILSTFRNNASLNTSAALKSIVKTAEKFIIPEIIERASVTCLGTIDEL